MRSDKSGPTIPSLVLLLIAALPAANGSGATTEWDKGVGIWQWNNAANWTAGVPGVGDTANFRRINWAQPIGIDTNGATLNLGGGKLTGNYNGSVEVLYDSAFLTPNSDPLGSPTNFSFGGYGSLEAAAAASPMITVSEINFSKQHQLHVYHPVTVDNLNDNGSNYTFYGPVIASTKVNLVGRDDTSDVVEFRNPVNTPDMEIQKGTVIVNDTTTIGTLSLTHSRATFVADGPTTIGTLNMPLGTFDARVVPTFTTVNWTGGVWAAGADGALPAATPFALTSGQALRFDAVQSAIPQITVGGGAALAGNMTNVVYTPGPGQNVIFQNDGIHAPNPEAATPLQKSDLGAGVSVWLGVTSRGSGDVWQAGDDGTSPYKGLAFDTNSFTPGGETRSTFRANPGSGDLLLRVNNLLDLEYRGPYWIGDGTSTTADFDMVAPSSRIDLRRRFNEGSSDPDRILTFNIHRDTPNAGDILTTNQQTGIYADQTVNVSGGRVRMSAMITRFEGNLSITDGILEQPGDFTAGDTGTLTVAGKTFVEVPDPANLDTYEALGARFVYPKVGDPDPGQVTAVLWGNKTYSVDPAATPVMAEFLQNVDITRQQYHTLTFDRDLPLGHGKFLYNLYDRTSGNPFTTSNGSKITYAGNAPGGQTPWIGFAAMRADTTIDLDVDAPGAVVQIGTTDPDRLTHRLAPNYGGTNDFISEVPAETVRFRRSVTAAGIRVRSGTARFDQDLTTDTVDIGLGSTLRMDTGRTATVNQRLTGGGTWTGGNGIVLAGGATLAPGDSAGTLTGESDLIVEGGAIYEWELADPDGAPGTGWDLLQSDSLIEFQADLTLLLADAGLTRDVDQEFLVAATTGALSVPGMWNVTIDPGATGWNVLDAQLLPRQDDLYLRLHATLEQQPPPEIIPEPGTMVLSGLMLAGLVSYARRRRKAA